MPRIKNYADPEKCRAAGRMRILFVAAVVLILLLSGRLFYIQVFCHEEFSKAAVSQYGIPVKGLDTRGQIFDRNGEALTGNHYEYYYIISKDRVDRRLTEMKEKGLLTDITRSSEVYRIYRSDTYDSSLAQTLKDDYEAYVFRLQSRYEKNQTAAHLIGYLNEAEEKGVSGLELFCEDRLKVSGSYLSVWADAAGKILPGIPPQITQADQSIMASNSVITTLDKDLQETCEKLLAQTGTNGACIISECTSGEILAMASAPGFDPTRLEHYMTNAVSDAEKDCLVNKAIQGTYPPGSVFKLVTAAAALENGVCDIGRKFRCEGEVTVEGITVKCSTAPEGGHGELSMTEAMAKSCNCYFAKLGEKTGYKDILQMAEKLGMGNCCLPGFPGESAGNLPAVSESADCDITNLSIGQGKLLATPLQINQITATIGTGGLKTEMQILKDNSIGTTGGNGQFRGLETGEYDDDMLSGREGERILSEETAEKLQEVMRAVMTEGTGSHISWDRPVWGKSGTAETVWGSEYIKNCWFTGFFDVESDKETGSTLPNAPGQNVKRYAVTVLLEKGISGSASALPVFRGIFDYLSKN